MNTQAFTLEQLYSERVTTHTASESDTKNSINATTPLLKLHTVLQNISTLLTHSTSLSELLHSLTSAMMRITKTDCCVLLLADAAQQYLVMHTCAPNLDEKTLGLQPVAFVDEVWVRLRDGLIQGYFPVLDHAELESLNPLKNMHYEMLIPIPLYVGNECIGLLNCYAQKKIAFADEDMLLVHTIASQAALAIKNRQREESGTDAIVQQSHVTALLHALFSEDVVVDDAVQRHARFLGCDLTKAHAVVAIEWSWTAQANDVYASEHERRAVFRDVVKRMKHYMYTTYTGSLVDERGDILLCLLCLDKDHTIDQANAWCHALLHEVVQDTCISLAAGVSNLCTTLDDYPKAYIQAKIALEIGQCLHGEQRSTLFNTLGVYRYIYPFARTDSLSDLYQQQVATIVAYDQRKKTNLLDTLETYLECNENIAKVSKQLGVHRNTMLQRLDRLQSLCNYDLGQCEHWFPLLIAIKLYRLRHHT